MREVTKEEFFERIMKLTVNVHPYIRHAKWSRDTGYMSDWKTDKGTLIGISQGTDMPGNNKYWLAD